MYHQWLSILTWSPLALAAVTPWQHENYPNSQPAFAPQPVAPRLLASTSKADIFAAEDVIKKAIAEMTKRNKARLAHPARTPFALQRDGGRVSRRDAAAADPPPPLLKITTEIARAAALLAERDAAAGFYDEADSHESRNSSIESKSGVVKRDGTFWMESIARKGSVPWGNDGSYKASSLRFVDSGPIWHK